MAPRNDLYNYDASERERSALNSVLNKRQASAEDAIERISVEEARRGESLYEAVSDRDLTRLLFISADESLLNQTQQTLDGYLNLSDVFDEVHIVILRPGIPVKNPVLRVEKNMWLYIATAEAWWWTPVRALKLIREQLEFADGFRPDLIVARDPYESALVAYAAAKRYGRATQVHVLEDFTDPQFLANVPHAWWRGKVARWVLKRSLSVRTATNQIEQLIKKHFPHVPDVATLPRFNNYESLTHAPVQRSIKEKYPQFTFIMLYFGTLDHNSTAYQVIDAARTVLHNPRVGLVVVGDGSARTEFKKRSELLEIAPQVVFERTADDMAGYLKTADVLIVSDTDSAGDEMVIRGAAAGIPVIATVTDLRQDLFVDGESILLAEPDDVSALTAKLNIILNGFAMRKQLATRALHIVETRLHEDPSVYRLTYKHSVEAGLFAGETENAPVSPEAEADQIETV